MLQSFTSYIVCYVECNGKCYDEYHNICYIECNINTMRMLQSINYMCYVECRI